MNPLVSAMRSIVQYFQGAYQEFRRVTWPDRASLIRYTIMVVIAMVVAIAVLTAFDYGMQQIADRYLLR